MSCKSLDLAEGQLLNALLGKTQVPGLSRDGRKLKGGGDGFWVRFYREEKLFVRQRQEIESIC